MFTKIRFFNSLRKHIKEQSTLDAQREAHAGNQAMQLHFDRMQTELSKKNPYLNV